MNSWSLLLVELLAFLAGRLQPRDVDHEILPLGQELVQRRIDRADGHRFAAHALEDAVEVVTLQRQQLVQGLAPVGFVVGQDHLLDDRNATFAEENVLDRTEISQARTAIVENAFATLEEACEIAIHQLLQNGAADAIIEKPIVAAVERPNAPEKTRIVDRDHKGRKTESGQRQDGP